MPVLRTPASARAGRAAVTRVAASHGGLSACADPSYRYRLVAVCSTKKRPVASSVFLSSIDTHKRAAAPQLEVVTNPQVFEEAPVVSDGF